MTPLGKNTSKHMKSSLPKPKKGLQQPKGQHTRPSVKNKANIKNVIPKVNRNAESSMQAKPNINRTIPSLNTKTIPSKQSQPNISNAIPKIQETKTARPSTSNKSNTNGSFSTEQIQATNGKVHLSPEQSRQNMDARHIAPEQSRQNMESHNINLSQNQYNIDAQRADPQQNYFEIDNPQIEPQNDNFATHHNQAESTLDFEKLDEIENSSEYSSVTNRKLSNARSVNTSGERPPRRTKRKRHGTVVGITFLSLIAVLLVASILIPDSNFSETENRPLQEFPTISLDSYLSGTLQDDYQTYVEDQFPLRNLWVTINTFVMQLTGRIENNGVYHCSDSSLIQKFTKPSDNTPVDAILKFKAEHQDLKTYALIAPTAAGINEDKIPDYALPSNQKEYLDTINSQFKQAGITPIELWDTFMDNKDDQIYYKFDHHWTSQGAYLAYLQCASQMGITEATDKKYEDMLVSNTFQGSLASEGGYLLSGTEELHIFMRSDVETPSFVTYVEDKDKQTSPFVSSALDKKDAYQVFFGGNHPLIQIDNYSNAKRGTLLIIKDSYANCFIPFMIGDFDKILVVDPRYYTGNLNDLISSNSVINVLFCYNATTFSEDTSLSRMINAPAQTPTEAKEDVEAKLQEEANALLNN